MSSSYLIPAVALFPPDKDAVTGLCFWAGMLLLAAGTMIGLVISFKGDDGQKTVQQAKKDLDEAEQKAVAAAEEVRQSALEGPVDRQGVVAAADTAAAAAASAKTALDHVSGVIGALPEKLRFAGLLIMVGTVLIGVATVQVGKVPLF